VIPVPDYIRKLILPRAKYSNSDDANIFTLENHSYNESYFKTLWGKYKRRTTLLKEGQTLYSFRHTGAIRVYEKSGSLATLQRVMGHSDMKVSLTYLRGLEVKQLDVKDLPSLRLEQC
jgi:integrase